MENKDNFDLKERGMSKQVVIFVIVIAIFILLVSSGVVLKKSPTGLFSQDSLLGSVISPLKDLAESARRLLSSDLEQENNSYEKEKFSGTLSLETVSSNRGLRIEIDGKEFHFIDGVRNSVSGKYSHTTIRNIVEFSGGNNSAITVIRDGSFFISFEADNYLYEIYPSEDSRQRERDRRMDRIVIERKSLGKGANLESDTEPEDALLGELRGRGDNQNQELGIAWFGDDGSTVDIIAIYTPDYQIAKRGATNAVNSLLVDIAIANQIRLDSNIASHISPVYIGELPEYVEPSGDSDGALYEMVPGLGYSYTEYLYYLGVEHKADIQALWFDDGLGQNVCGLGSFPGSSVKLHHQCGATGRILAHELGHNFGCNHQISTAPQGGSPFVYGRAYNSIVGYSTIMYSIITSAQNKFSNPDLLGYGYPIGIEEGGSGEADCSKNHNQMRLTMSNLRVSCPTCQIPSAPPPVDIEALRVSPSQIDLTWNESNDPAVFKYYIYRSTVSGQACQPSDLIYQSPAFNSYSDTSVGSGEYYYSISSVLVKHPYYLDLNNPEFLEGSCSEIVSTATSGLDIPQNFMASDGTSNSVTALSWTPVNNALSYDLYRSNTPLACANFLKNVNSSMGFDTTGILNKKYYYSVKAKNSSVMSLCSLIDGGHTASQALGGAPFSIPNAPLNINASDGDFADKVLLSWSIPSSEIVNSYDIFRDDINCSASPLASVSSSQNYFEDISVVPDISYNYTVQSVGPGGNSVCSLFDSGYASSGNTVDCGNHSDVGGGLCEVGYYVSADGHVRNLGFGSESWVAIHDASQGFDVSNSPSVYTDLISTTFGNSYVIARAFYSFNLDIPQSAVLDSATLMLNPYDIKNNNTLNSSVVIFKGDTVLPLSTSDYTSKCDATIGSAGINNIIGQRSLSQFTIGSYSGIPLDISKINSAISNNKLVLCARESGEAFNDGSLVNSNGPRLRVYSQTEGQGPILKIRYRPQ